MFNYVTPTIVVTYVLKKHLDVWIHSVNYTDTVNTDDGSCYYAPGCNNSSYLEYYTQGFTADFDDGSCLTEAIWGCTDSTAFNFDTISKHW